MWRTTKLYCLFFFVMSRAACYKSPSDIRFVTRVAYDGFPFKGFQTQKPGTPTIQGTVLEALKLKLGPQTTIAGASRTDVGVHARGNCIHFDVPVEKLHHIADITKFEHQLNRMLPDTIRVFDLSTAPAGNKEEVACGKPFHATSSSIGKKYSYSFCTNPYVDPIRRRYFAHFYGELDPHLLEKSLQQFKGTHDFLSFANNVPRMKLFYESTGQVLDTVRTVDSVELREVDNGYYQINFRIQSALYRMIRNIVGASVRVAEGKMDQTQLEELLHNAPSREQNPARSAPPEGLVLEHVYYDNY